jgi:AraC-like DNA-binding protein
MGTTQETKRLREQGFFTSGAVARELGISLTTLRRLEGTLFEPVARHGKRELWIFTSEQVEVLKKALREKTGLGRGPHLLSLAEVAQRAGCSVATIRRRQGKELPAGQRVAYPRTMWGFTREEAKQIAAWVKRHLRGTRRRAAKVTK